MEVEPTESASVVLTPEDPRSKPRVITSVERGRGPRPGIMHAPFFWPDVVDSPPPTRRAKGEGAYTVYHALETGADSRITYSTIINVKQTGASESRVQQIEIDSRLGVQSRLFLEFIHKERAFMARTSARWRESLVSGLVRQRHAAKSLPYRWMRRGALWIVRAEGRAAHWGVKAVTMTTSAFVELPDVIYSRSMRAWSHVYGRLGRRTLLEDMKDPRNLTTEQKSTVLVLTAALLVGAIFLINNFVSFFLPRAAVAWSDLLNTFLWGAGTAVILPFPPSELLLIAPYLSAGIVLSFIAILASKVVGAWFVYFIGDALHAMIAKQTDGKPRMQKIVAWMNRNSERYGLVLLALFTALPFLPDTLALYVFAASGTNFKHYLWGVAIGTSIRYAGVLAILVLVGPDTLNAYFG